MGVLDGLSVDEDEPLPDLPPLRVERRGLEEEGGTEPLPLEEVDVVDPFVPLLLSSVTIGSVEDLEHLFFATGSGDLKGGEWGKVRLRL